jgi:hypothetical protein
LFESTRLQTYHFNTKQNQKNMKRILLVTVFLLSIFAFNEIRAQSYESAVGARAGYFLTGTYKKFINDSHAFEAYAGLAYFSGLVAGGLYQVHFPLEELEIENLYWYVGGGAYAGIGSGWLGTSSFNLGVNVNIGLDYKFEDYPINVSIDWAPGLDFVGRFGPTFVIGGVAVRYVLD